MLFAIEAGMIIVVILIYLFIKNKSIKKVWELFW
jgi:hypothetical protein